MKTKLLRKMREGTLIKYKKDRWVVWMNERCYEYKTTEKLILELIGQCAFVYDEIFEFPWRRIYEDYQLKINKRRFNR